MEIVGMIRDIQEQNNYSIGIITMKILLHKRGIKLSHNTIAKLMSENGLNSRVRCRKFPANYYKAMKELKKNLPKNILNRKFKVNAPGRVYVTDITYIPISDGWLYLSVMKDLFNKEIVSWAVSRSPNAELCVTTLERLAKKRNLSGAIIHSDQGSTYTSKAYRMKLKELGAIQSMSRKANCYDNACAESFFAVFKTCCFANERKELILHQLNGFEVYFKIEEWIRKYNHERIQKDLDWMTPVQYRFIYPNGRLLLLTYNGSMETA